MADTYTTNLNLTKPEPGAAEDTWGISLNSDLDALDAIFSSSGTQVNLNPNQVNFADNKKAVFGTGSDFLLFHDGSNSFIKDEGTGYLNITTNGTDIRLQKNTGEYMAKFIPDGAVELYYNNAKKVETTSTGIDVTGTATMDGLTVEGLSNATATTAFSTTANSPNASLIIGNSGSTTGNGNYKGALGFAKAGTSSQIRSAIVGKQTASSNNVQGLAFLVHPNSVAGTLNEALLIKANNDIAFYDDTGTSENMVWDASEDSLEFVDNAKIKLGASGDLSMYHDGTNTSFNNFTGDLLLRQFTDDKDVLIQSDAGDGTITTYFRADGSTGETKLYNYGNLKLTTTNTGIDVTGTVTSDGLTVQGNSAEIVINDTDTTDTPTLRFRESGTTAAIIKTDSQNLIFTAGGGTERARIDSSGYLIVNKTSSGISTAGALLSSVGSHITRDGGSPLSLNRLTSDGAILDIRKDGTTVGSIGAYNSATAILSGSAASYSGLYLNTNKIEPVGNNFGSEIRANDTIDIGSSTYKFKDLHLSGSASSVGGYINTNSGSNPLYVTRQGNTNESLKIHVSDSAAIFESIQDETADNYGAFIFAMDDGVTEPFFDIRKGTASSGSKFYVDGSGNVGIGTTSPLATLHVGSGSGSLNTAAELFIPNNDALMRQIKLGHGSGVANITADDSSKPITLSAGGSERARIDSSGHFLVATTNASNTVAGFRAYSGGNIGIAINGQSAEFNRLDSNGNILEFKKDGTNIGYIGSEGGNTFYIVNDDTGIRFAGGSDVIVPCGANGASSDNLISLGLSVLRFKDLHLGGTGYFGTSVGIGTTSTDAPLTVHNSSDPEIRFGYSSTQDHKISWDSSKVFIDADPENANGSSAIGFRVDGSEKARIDTSGNVGIGTSSIDAKLEVQNSTTATDTIIASAGLATAGNYHDLILGDSRNYAVGLRRHITQSNPSFLRPRLDFIVQGQNTYLPSNREVKMSIKDNGNVGIGETSPQNPLHVRSDSASGENYAIQIDNNNTTVGSQIGMLFRSRVGTTNTDFSIRGIANGADDMDLTFNSDGGSERLRITKDGLIGIGTSSPGEKLTVSGNTLTYGSTGNVGAGASYFLGNSQNSRDIVLTRVGSATLGIGYYSGGWQESARFDSSGRLLIGQTSSNGDKLEIQSDANVYAARLNGSTTGGQSYGLRVRAGSNSSDAGLLVENTSGTDLFKVRGDGNVGIGTSSPSSILEVNAPANNGVKISSTSPYLFFNDTDTANVYDSSISQSGATLNIGGATPAQTLNFRNKASFGESARITTDGKFYVGTTSAQTSNSDITTKAAVSGDVYLNGVRFNTDTNEEQQTVSSSKLWMDSTDLYIGSTLIETGATSDIRLKENIENIPNAIEKVKLLNGVTFNYKKKPDVKEAGFIAQDVQKALPEAVYTAYEDNEEVLALRYNRITSVLVEAIKEQQEQIESLKSEIAKLKGE